MLALKKLAESDLLVPRGSSDPSLATALYM